MHRMHAAVVGRRSTTKTKSKSNATVAESVTPVPVQQDSRNDRRVVCALQCYCDMAKRVFPSDRKGPRTGPLSALAFLTTDLRPRPEEQRRRGQHVSLANACLGGPCAVLRIRRGLATLADYVCQPDAAAFVRFPPCLRWGWLG